MTLDNSEPIYPISVAAKLLSVHPRTLRIYEEENLIKPARQGNKRYFSNNDIEWITCLRTLIHEKGISIPGINVLRLIGEGGMSRVYLASREGEDEPLVVKSLRSEVTGEVPGLQSVAIAICALCRRKASTGGSCFSRST